jgi:hypothetical protein
MAFDFSILVTISVFMISFFYYLFNILIFHYVWNHLVFKKLIYGN